MIPVSDAWKAAHARTIVPEQFVEISIGVMDTAAINSGSVVPVKEGSTSDTSTVLGVNEATTPTGYATLEENLWTLDGTKKIRPDETAKECGYVGYCGMLNLSQIKVVLPEATTKAIPGFIIVWSSEYKEYPTSFSIDLKKGDDWRGSVRVDNNHSYISSVDIPSVSEISDYDTVMITVHEWNTPNHNVRIERVVLGYSWVFGKKDILSFSHEQSSDLLCAELPKNSIEFSLDNTDGKWNPYNPRGIGKYLSERQSVVVRYGTDINGTTEWIRGGEFYLTEWDAPANGLEARFVARDPFEFMADTMYDATDGIPHGTFKEIIECAAGMCEFPGGLEMNIESQWRSIDAWAPRDYYELVKDVNGNVRYENPKYTAAEIIQMCVSAMGAVCCVDRNGILQIVDKPWEKNADLVYEIPLDIAYSYPEISLNKPVKYLEVRFDPSDADPNVPGYYRFDLALWDNGVTQTIDYLLGLPSGLIIQQYFYWKAVFAKRAVVSGEFRADPRLDVFDNVRVSTKYGDMDLIITRIKYTYNGSFRGEYTAQGIEAIVETTEGVAE